MHEATLAARMLQIAEEAAAKQQGNIRAVTAVIGDIAGVMTDSLTFAFDALKKNTRLCNAELKIEHQRVLVCCRDCGTQYAPSGFPFVCPHCAGRGFRIVHGEEVYVKNLEVEENVWDN